MSRKKTEKQELLAAGTPAKKSMENSYSNLPLFDYNVSNTLHLAMDKEKGFQVQSEDRFTRTPPFPEKSQARTAKSPKPKISKAPPVAAQSATRHPLKDLTETSSVLLTVSDICKLLKVSRSTLIRIEKAGQLPGRLMLGGSVRYHRETIDAWLNDLAANRP